MGTSAGMRQDNFPHPVSDPEAEGLPGYADDDSSASDNLEAVRIADGPDPAALPSDHPLAVDRYGTTAEEARLGESLDYKLAREYPDDDGERAATARTQDDEGDALTDETDRVHGPAAELQGVADPPVDPYAKVSMYDRADDPYEQGRPIGRLAEVHGRDGDGTGYDTDTLAYDAGAAGGGPSAEETAMHEVRDP